MLPASLNNSTLLVSEIFGPTFQGEGRRLGQQAIFVRLGTCNLHCTWCDTPYTWDTSRFDLQKELRRMTVAQVITEIESRAKGLHGPSTDEVFPLIVISGGEPMIQIKNLEALVKHGASEHWVMEIETNGTLPPFEWHTYPHYNVSPKLSNSGNDPTTAIVPKNIQEYAYRSSIFKFVVDSERELDEVDNIVSRAHIYPGSVYIMPQGVTLEQLSRTGAAIAECVLQRGYNMTTRLHVQLWGDTRGR